MPSCVTGLILGLCPANERQRYFVTTSLIGWDLLVVFICHHDTLEANIINPSYAETRIFQNRVNTMAADELAPSVLRSSAAMVLTKLDNQVRVFHNKGLQ